MGKVEFSGYRNLIERSLKTLRSEGFDRLFLYGTRYLSWKIQLHQYVRSLPNPMAKAIYVLVRGLVRRLIWLLNKIYLDKYTDADPYKQIYVEPSSIELTTGEIFSKRRGWVVDGEWDSAGKLYMQRTFAKAIEQRFVDGVEWDQTVLAEKYDKSTLDERGKEIDRLHQQILDEGYKSQRQLLKQSPETAWNGLNDAMHPLANEIAVDIGRDGELLWNMCGQHRLAIAKVLEIDRIPVQVFRRHSQWQEIRERARRGEEIPEKFHSHPDLADVLEKE